MSLETPSLAAPSEQGVRRPWCRWLALAIVLIGAALNLGYLWNHCPISLSEDESHYWEWSRHLDLGYYSKGPGIAWIMWLATRIGHFFGMAEPSMALLRTPAVLFSILTGMLSIGLARRIYRDDRPALMVTVLSASVPLFVVGAMLLTIDSPMFLCWAFCVYALWRRIEGGGLSWLYATGLVMGLGMLCKPVPIAIPICGALAAWASPTIKNRLANIHSLFAIMLAFVLQTPILIWNAQHGWVMFHHMATQGGLAGTPVPFDWLGPFKRFGEYVGGQAGILAGIIFIMLVCSIISAVRESRKRTEPETPRQMGLKFLLAFTLPLWLFYAVLSLWKGTEANWPAASYFTGMVLLAGNASTGWNAVKGAKGRCVWRFWIITAAVIGLLVATFIQHTEWLYPLAKTRMEASGKGTASAWHPLKWDKSIKKIRGFEERGLAVDTIRQAMQKEMGHEPLIVTGRYDLSSSLAFYLPGRPFVYSIGSLLGDRQSQYDIWPGLNERIDEKFVHQGADVLFVGALDPAPGSSLERLTKAFDRMAPPESVPVMYQGVRIFDVVVWRCYGFKGLPTSASGKY